MAKKFYKILSLVVCLCLIFEQIGFTQVTGSAALTTSAQLDIADHLTGLHRSFVQDRFRPLHLRYLSYDTLTNNFSLLLDKGSAAAVENSELENAAQFLMKYFFTGLALPNESFWVNLRPDASDNIIDESLGQTDVGRVMLEADVQLKKDAARYTSPETPTGKEYWDKLYKKAGELFGSENITISTLTRPWIVPGTIIITETKNGAYIYKATLKVMLEQDYLKESAAYSFKDERLRALNEYSSQLIRELVIPQITKEVNSSKKYASLRQVYYSLIFAQWFKQKFTSSEGYYSRLIDTRDLTHLTSKIPWSKSTYFQEYQKSFKDGEYNIKEPVYTPYGQTIRSYFSGGLALTVKPEDIQSAPQEAIPQRPYLDSVDYMSTGPNAGEARTTPQRRRDNQGRFLNEEGKSSEDMVRILSDSEEYRDNPFTIKQYRTLWQEVYRDELPQSTAYSDLGGAVKKGWIEKTDVKGYYKLSLQVKSLLVDSIAQKIKRKERLTVEEMDTLIKRALMDVGLTAEQVALTIQDKETLQFALLDDPMSFFTDDHFQTLYLGRKIKDFMNLPPLMRDRLHQKMAHQQQVPLEMEYLYINGKKTALTLDAVSRLQEQALTNHKIYFEVITPIITTNRISRVIAPIQFMSYDQFGIDWIASVVLEPNGRKRYYSSTVADTSQTPMVMEGVLPLARKNEGDIVVFGGIQPVIRDEDVDRIRKDWREQIFPQVDIKTISFRPSDAMQQCMEILSICHLVDSLRLLGFGDNSRIIIRMNNHWGILGRLLERSGLNIMEIREFRLLFNELSISRVRGLKWQELKNTIGQKLKSYYDAGIIKEDVFYFFQRIIAVQIKLFLCLLRCCPN